MIPAGEANSSAEDQDSQDRWSAGLRLARRSIAWVALTVAGGEPMLLISQYETGRSLSLRDTVRGAGFGSARLAGSASSATWCRALEDEQTTGDPTHG